MEAKKTGETSSSESLVTNLTPGGALNFSCYQVLSTQSKETLDLTESVGSVPCIRTVLEVVTLLT